MHRTTEDQVLGALLGVAIGDALGLPVTGLSATEVRVRHGAFAGYLPRPDAPDGQPAAGEISDKTETLLCIIESLTTNDGMLDPININARLGFLLNGASRDLMSEPTARGIEDAANRDGRVSEEVVSPPELGVAVRGVAVGLLHAVGARDEAAMIADVQTVTRLTHGGEAAARLTALVARATEAAARFGDDVGSWPRAHVQGGDDLGSTVAAVVERARAAATFEDVVLPTVHNGGEASALGAIAGGVAGARFGASGIPQELIDELDARIYLSMAAPWFFRTIMRRAGTVIDLRVIE